MIDKTKDKTKVILVFTRVGYIIGCFVLFLIAFVILAYGVTSIAKEFFAPVFNIYHLLDEVGLIVFSIAVIDVAKYLTVEEILRGSENRSPKEERKTLTKFVIIIATALALEGLVLTIETAKIDMERLIYPSILLFSSIFFILAIGVYQRLASVERD